MSRNQAKRRQIQKAVDNIVAGKAAARDYNVIRNKELMAFASGDQVSAVLGAKGARKLPPDVYAAAADTLRIRWQVFPRRRMNGGASRLA